jgi:hypothetical protein
VIALGRRKDDTSDVANACAAVPRRGSRELVAELIGAPAAELDIGKAVLEAVTVPMRPEPYSQQLIRGMYGVELGL